LQFTEDMLPRESFRAAPLHLEPSAEEVSHAVIDLSVDGFIGWGAGSVREIRCPTGQKPVQPLAPRAHVARPQQASDALGLSLNEAKTSVKNARAESFDFLGFSVLQRHGKEFCMNV